MSAGSPGAVGDPSGAGERELRGRGSGKGRGPRRRGRRWAGKRDSGQRPESEAAWDRGASAPSGPGRPGPQPRPSPPEHVRRRRFGVQRRRPPHSVRVSAGRADPAYLTGRSGRERALRESHQPPPGREPGRARRGGTGPAVRVRVRVREGPEQHWGGASAQSRPFGGALRGAARGRMPRAGPTP